VADRTEVGGGGSHLSILHRDQRIYFFMHARALGDYEPAGCLGWKIEARGMHACMHAGPGAASIRALTTHRTEIKAVCVSNSPGLVN
jgi:hypothetical protein